MKARFKQNAVLPSFQYISAYFLKFLSQIKACEARVIFTYCSWNITLHDVHVVDELTMSVGSIISCLLLSSYCSGPFHFFFVLPTYNTKLISASIN